LRLYLSSFRLGGRPGELVRLLGGGTRMAVVANAGDLKPPEERAAAVARELADLAALGLDAAELDLREHFGGGDGLAARLAGLDGLWVRGGNAFVLRRAFRQSGLDALLPGLLARDALVYAGYSAGAAVLAPSLRAVELVDDPGSVPEGYDPAVVWDGLGLLAHPVLPHYRSDHPESPDAERAVQRLIDDHVPFVALRDGEAIVRDGAGETVVA
jgi:dipeptidase E